MHEQVASELEGELLELKQQKQSLYVELNILLMRKII